MILIGVLSALLSVAGDFIIETGEKFSMGFAQVGVMLVGLILIAISIFLHVSPKELKTGLLGSTASDKPS